MIRLKNWTEAQKRQASFGFMVVVFVGLLGFGFWSLYQTIYGPFVISAQGERLAAQFRAAITSENLRLEQEKAALLKQFESRKTLPQPEKSETNVLGILNPTELRASLKQAGMSEEQLAKINDTELLAVYNETLAEQQKQSGTVDLGQTKLADLQKLTAPQIRDVLLKNGMKKEDLDKVDDKSLQEMFQKVLAEQMANANK